ncbi:MAG TPA: ATP-binding protein [Pyrinomonadaceae bacterium]|nr:ATP-binding protein [Pyrinomonadaceae bacterium]
MDLQDRVEHITATIGDLRNATTDGPKSRQLIEALFRAVHSFKAAASAEGRDDLSRIAHEFEDLLHSLRTGKLTLDERVLQTFDTAAIALREGSSFEGLPKLTHETHHDRLPAEFGNLRDDERHRAVAARQEGANLYVMEVVFEASDFDERFRKLKERLEKNAEPISISPSMEDDKIVFKVVYASRSEKIPSQTVIQQALRAGEAVAAKLGKQVEFVVRGEEIVLERRWADVLTDALLHLVRNAVDHGIESHGTVTITTEESQITVTDDGRGIEPENLPLLFQPGFTTANDVTDYSGRGVGLDVVKTTVEELGGSVSVASEPAKGSSFKIKISNQDTRPIKTPNPSSDA